MVSLSELWLPILVAAILVFVISSVIHMVVKWHNVDYARMPGEDEVRAAMRTAGVKPGSYMFPHCDDMKDFALPEVQEKYKTGPVGWMTVLPNGLPSIGKSLWQWFLFSLLIGAISGYMGTLSLRVGAEFGAVFRVTGTAAILGYAVANIPESIWKGQAWSATLKYLGDGVLYGLATGAAFAWFWPEPGSLL